MTQPFGAIVNSAVSLTKTVRNPSVSNVVAAATDVVAVGQDPSTTASVTKAGPLITTTFNALTQGQPLNLLNTTNQAVKLATGFMDPETASLVGAVSGGLNQLFGVGGALGPASPLLGGGAGGNKPIALHTESMAKQNMSSAYAESRDVVFSFVRANSALTSAIDDGVGFGEVNLGVADSSPFDLNSTKPFDIGQPVSANSTTFSPPDIGTIGSRPSVSGGVR